MVALYSVLIPAAAIVLSASGGACDHARTQQIARRLEYEIVRSYPHDPDAFLQGLVWHDGGFFESTGQYGKSTLRRVEVSSGRVVKSIRLAPELFGEGIALVGKRIIQLTWKEKKGLVYDRDSLLLLREFRYETEGWGLAYNGAQLILSDGSSRLAFLDPESFAPVRRLSVTMNGRPLENINELEYIEGEIWANVWLTDWIVRINPQTGTVTSFLDLEGILPDAMRTGREDVLNGIAYDARQKRIFISGKLWPRIFEIRIKEP